MIDRNRDLDLMEKEVIDALQKIRPSERLSEGRKEAIWEILASEAGWDESSTTKLPPSRPGRDYFWKAVAGIASAAAVFAITTFFVYRGPGDGNQTPITTTTKNGQAPQAYQAPAISPEVTSGDSLPKTVKEKVAGFYTRDPVCGPWSLWAAASRIGVPCDFESLKKSCNVSEDGTAIIDLAQAARGLGLDAVAARIGLKELLELDTTAVLHIADNHFLCVDPREEGENANLGKVRVYDDQAHGDWLGLEKLVEDWEGVALILRKQEAREPVTGPRVEFACLFTDFGSTPGGEIISQTYPFKNIGSGPLHIKEIIPSCGCTDAVATKEVILPGEDAEIFLTLDLAGRKGPQRIVVKVETNDPENPVIPIFYQGFVESPIIASVDELDFGELLPGQVQTQFLAISDDGTQDLKLISTSILWNENQPTALQDQLPEIRVDFVGDPNFPEERGEKIFAGLDFVVPPDQIIGHECHVKARVPPTAPVGEYRGALTIVAGPDPDQVVSIPICVQVVGDLRLSERKVILWSDSAR